ncbi:hypothetical protein [Streptomyces chattanoogensis]|uniref:hypothetical protein n=1 Tax=Streptomyces chattanoogensis TaxID=66876 RepID=UPI0005D83BFE|nr:hypothetical protein T261_0105 [Streptomyces lydicus]
MAITTPIATQHTATSSGSRIMIRPVGEDLSQLFPAPPASLPTIRWPPCRPTWIHCRWLMLQ